MLLQVIAIEVAILIVLRPRRLVVAPNMGFENWHECRRRARVHAVVQNPMTRSKALISVHDRCRHRRKTEPVHRLKTEPAV